MKKKIIKFCFFNNEFREPAVKYLACFSKRAIKSKRQLHKYQILKKKKYKFNKEILQKILTYKKFLRNSLYYNQWTLQNTPLMSYFLTSYFKKKFRNRRRLLLLWYKIRKRYSLTTYRFITRYTNTGIISSHFVHFLLSKNMVYQNRSKYRSKIYDTMSFSYYVYFCTKLVYTYNNGISRNMYQFTSNFSKTNIRVNDDFTLNFEGWIPYTVKADAFCKNLTSVKRLNSNALVLNPTLFNMNHLQTLQKNRELILKYNTETDSTQRELSYQKILANLDTDSVVLLAYYSNMFISNRAFIPTQLSTQYILSSLFLYKQLI